LMSAGRKTAQAPNSPTQRLRADGPHMRNTSRWLVTPSTVVGEKSTVTARGTVRHFTCLPRLWREGHSATLSRGLHLCWRACLVPPLGPPLGASGLQLLRGVSRTTPPSWIPHNLCSSRLCYLRCLCYMCMCCMYVCDSCLCCMCCLCCLCCLCFVHVLPVLPVLLPCFSPLRATYSICSMYAVLGVLLL
jgi:hypothetical protein